VSALELVSYLSNNSSSCERNCLKIRLDEAYPRKFQRVGGVYTQGMRVAHMERSRSGHVSRCTHGMACVPRTPIRARTERRISARAGAYEARNAPRHATPSSRYVQERDGGGGGGSGIEHGSRM